MKASTVVGRIELEPSGGDKAVALKSCLKQVLESNGIVPSTVVLRAVNKKGVERILEYGNDRTDQSQLYEACERDVAGALGISAGKLTFGLYTHNQRGYEWLLREKFPNEQTIYLAIYKKGRDLAVGQELPKYEEGLVCLDDVIRGLTGWQKRECMFYIPPFNNPKELLLGCVQVDLGQPERPEVMTYLLKLLKKLKSREARARFVDAAASKHRVPQRIAEETLQYFSEKEDYIAAARFAKKTFQNFDGVGCAKKVSLEGKHGEAARTLMVAGNYPEAIRYLELEDKFGNGKNEWRPNHLALAQEAIKNGCMERAIKQYEDGAYYQMAARLSAKIGDKQKEEFYSELAQFVDEKQS